MVQLPVIVGPTAVGKTRIACEVAPLVGAEIVSADSRQVYKLMDIGTAKPSPQLRQRIPHHMLDLVSPDEDYSAADYARDAGRAIDELFARGTVPLVVGGSGLYIRALVDRFFESPGSDRETRRRLLEEARGCGAPFLHARLRRIDPEAAGRIHPRDIQRIVRALEVYKQTGLPISQLQGRDVVRRFSPTYIGLLRDRRGLYEAIEERVDEMVDNGFLEEVDSLLKAGYSPELNSFSAVGYREMAGHLRGDLDLEEAIALTKRNSKRYAKRQLTWFRGIKEVHWMETAGVNGISNLARNIAAIIQASLGDGSPKYSSLSDNRKGELS